MTDEAPPLPAGGAWRAIRRRSSAVAGRIGSLWRHSLQFRTVLITIGLSGLAILVIGLYITFSIASNLFESQRDRALDASNSAAAAAQTLLESSAAADRGALQSVLDQTVRTVQTVSGSSAIAVLRSPDQEPSTIAPQDRITPALTGLISDELRASVQENADSQFWQSVSLGDEAGEDPGIVVGTDLVLP